MLSTRSSLRKPLHESTLQVHFLIAADTADCIFRGDVYSSRQARTMIFFIFLREKEREGEVCVLVPAERMSLAESRL